MVGWYGVPGAATGTRASAVTPARVLDTRVPTGSCTPAPCGAIGPDASTTVSLAGQGGVPATGATAVILNVTVTQPTASSFLTVYPSDATAPTASNLNFSTGQTVPNLVVVKLGADGAVKLYNFAGNVHVIADVVGWFNDGS